MSEQVTSLRYRFCGLVAATLVTVGSLGNQTFASNLLVNGSFEYPAFGPTGWSYGTSGADWAFNDFSGITRLISAWDGYVLAPEGNQVAFLQRYQGVNSSIVQSFTVPASGEFRLTYWQRGRSLAGNLTYNLELDGTVLDTLTATTGQPGEAFSEVGLNFHAASGLHTLAFVAVSQLGSDDTVLLDDVTITPVPEPTWTALAAGLGTLFFVAWRRRERTNFIPHNEPQSQPTTR